MRQVGTSETQSETIKVKIVQMGAETFILTLPVDATVGEAFAEADLTYVSGSVLVDGVNANSEDELEDGDIINIVTNKDGGVK